MTAILSIIFPIYATIVIGYAIVAKGWFSASDMRVLGKYVMNIALPALLFNAVASRDVADVFRPDYMLVILLGGLGVIGLAWVWFSQTGIDRPRRAIAIMGATSTNSGFVGYPLMLLTFPDIAGVILALNMLVENIILVPICLVLMDMAKPGEPLPILQTIWRTFLGVVRRPMVIGLLLGLLVSLADIPIPGAMSRLFTMLAASAAALSLIVVGGSLVGLKSKGNRARAMQIAVGKLLVHPGMVAVVAMGLSMMGIVSLTQDMYAAAILSAAMPMFGIYTVLAQELDLEVAASTAMLVTTVMAFMTLTGFLYWLT